MRVKTSQVFATPNAAGREVRGAQFETCDFFIGDMPPVASNRFVGCIFERCRFTATHEELEATGAFEGSAFNSCQFGMDRHAIQGIQKPELSAYEALQKATREAEDRKKKLPTMTDQQAIESTLAQAAKLLGRKITIEGEGEAKVFEPGLVEQVHQGGQR